MGYDLHITRRKDWCNEGDDIGFEEFVAYVRGDKEFTYPGQLGDDAADWRSPKTGYESWLCWSEGQAYTKNPEPEFMDKLVAVAGALGAKLQGDDGEVYLSSTEVQGKDVASSAPAPCPPRSLPAFFHWPRWKLMVVGFLLGCVLLGLKLLIFGK